MCWSATFTPGFGLYGPMLGPVDVLTTILKWPPSRYLDLGLEAYELPDIQLT